MLSIDVIFIDDKSLTMENRTCLSIHVKKDQTLQKDSKKNMFSVQFIDESDEELNDTVSNSVFVADEEENDDVDVNDDFEPKTPLFDLPSHSKNV
jgi:hypothetical protein